MNIPDFNLDDEHEVKEFIDKYGTLKKRGLANRLGLHGKYSAILASQYSNYAWNKFTAINLRATGRIEEALEYEAICDKIYDSIKPEYRPW